MSRPRGLRPFRSDSLSKLHLGGGAYQRDEPRSETQAASPKDRRGWPSRKELVTRRAGRLATCDCFFHDGEEEGGAAHQCFQRLDLCAAASSKRKDTARLEAAGSSDPHFEVRTALAAPVRAERPVPALRYISDKERRSTSNCARKSYPEGWYKRQGRRRRPYRRCRQGGTAPKRRPKLR